MAWLAVAEQSEVARMQQPLAALGERLARADAARAATDGGPAQERRAGPCGLFGDRVGRPSCRPPGRTRCWRSAPTSHRPATGRCRPQRLEQHPAMPRTARARRAATRSTAWPRSGFSRDCPDEHAADLQPTVPARPAESISGDACDRRRTRLSSCPQSASVPAPRPETPEGRRTPYAGPWGARERETSSPIFTAAWSETQAARGLTPGLG